MPTLLKYLKDLTTCPLLEHVGERVNDRKVNVVPDWDACLESMKSLTWVNLGTRMMNRIWHQASEVRGAEWFDDKWNPLIVATKETINNHLLPIVEPVMRREKLPMEFFNFLTGYVLKDHLLQEFPDDEAQAWSSRIIQWLREGHVPCGFTGTLPPQRRVGPDRLPNPDGRGKMIVY